MVNFTDTGLISPEELQKCLEQDAISIKLVDASYGLSGNNNSPKDNFSLKRIDNAVFFDIDAIADPYSDMPHMLPPPEQFEKAVSQLGISNNDLVIVYDQSGLAMAACRVWWMFRVFGHNRVCVLDGGLPFWESQGYPVKTDPPISPKPGQFTAEFRKSLVKSKQELLDNLSNQNMMVVDARSTERFNGASPESRPNLRSGHIPGSCNLPFINLLDLNTGCLKDINDLEYNFNLVPQEKPLVASCGSGVTACIVAFAFHVIGRHDVAVYDGSWTEWGAVHEDETQNAPVTTSL